MSVSTPAQVLSTQTSYVTLLLLTHSWHIDWFCAYTVCCIKDSQFIWMSMPRFVLLITFYSYYILIFGENSYKIDLLASKSKGNYADFTWWCSAKSKNITQMMSPGLHRTTNRPQMYSDWRRNLFTLHTHYLAEFSKQLYISKWHIEKLYHLPVKKFKTYIV